MKNPWKTCHPFCWVHRVYGMQNDRLDLTVILVEKNCEKMHCIQRYLHFFVHFSSLVLQISRDTMHFLAIFFSKNDREIEPVVLHTINPMNSTKWVTSFSWIFDFSLIDFSKKIIEIFFHKCLLLWEYVELFTRLELKICSPTLFFGTSGRRCSRSPELHTAPALSRLCGIFYHQFNVIRKSSLKFVINTISSWY